MLSAPSNFHPDRLAEIACSGLLAPPVGSIETPHQNTTIEFELFAPFNKNFGMYRLDLTLHSLPDSLNKGLRGHRMKYFKKNARWDILIFGMVRHRLPAQPLSKARITITRHFWRTLDYDGLVGSMKPVVDALVSAGVLQDDSWGVTGAWVVDQQFRPKKDGPLLTVTIEQITAQS